MLALRMKNGSGGRIRTYDLVVNSHPLCLLSYAGTVFEALRSMIIANQAVPVNLTAAIFGALPGLLIRPKLFPEGHEVFELLETH